jgi:tyrosyl-tRNA synthetase
MSNLYVCLKERGFIDQSSSPELETYLNQSRHLYVGFDPTADSLHLGNLMGIIALTWAQKFGHTPHVLLGCGTAKIGDPSGKSKERPLLSEKQLGINAKSIEKFFISLFEKNPPAPVIENNDLWLNSLPLLDFLRDIGKEFRLSVMLAKESVKTRLQSEEGMSFTEFTYQMLQAYDFYHLFQEKGVTLQMGGSDQWGNITAGLELIRKMTGTTCYGLTFPLLTRSDGKKFGKTESGAVWLSGHKMSPYDFYQYLFRVPDQDVIKMMKLLTFMDLEEVDTYEKQMQMADYKPNTAQARLAEEVTRFVHGTEGVASAKTMTDAARPGSEAKLDVHSIEQMMQTLPTTALTKSDVLGKKYTEIVSHIGLTSSKSEATKLIKNKGAYLNNHRIEDPSYLISDKDIIGKSYILFSSGKKKRMIVHLKS